MNLPGGNDVRLPIRNPASDSTGLPRQRAAEAAEELHQVGAVAVAVALVAEEAGVALPLAQAADEPGQVADIDVAVAVAVAEEPEVCGDAVAARGAVAVAVQLPAGRVADLVAADRQHVVAVGQRAADHALA